LEPFSRNPLKNLIQNLFNGLKRLALEAGVMLFDEFLAVIEDDGIGANRANIDP
jgi:hypothetical protein